MNQTNKGFFAGIAVFTVMILIPFFTAGARDSGAVKVMPEKQPEFQEALKHYLAADYQRSFAAFEVLASSSEIHQYMTAALLMAGTFR